MSRWRFYTLFTLVTGLLFLLFYSHYRNEPPLAPAAEYDPVNESSLKTDPIPFNRTLLAVIIEPRNDPLLLPVLHNFFALLPPEWPFLVFCSDSNHDTLLHASSLQGHLSTGKLEIRLLPQPANHVFLETESISRLLTSVWFWTNLPCQAEYALLFQTDSILCSNAGERVQDWLGYDYVGGPTDWTEDGYGGNGGLSIRRIRSMLRIARRHREEADGEGVDREWVWPQDWFAKPGYRSDGRYYTSEDVFFVHHLKELRRQGEDVRWPKDDGLDQGRFSLDTWRPERPVAERRPWGVHVGAHIQEYVMRYEDGAFTEKSKALVDYCPEVLMLRFGMPLKDGGEQAQREIAKHPEETIPGKLMNGTQHDDDDDDNDQYMYQ